MRTPSKSTPELLKENAELRARLEEAEQTLRAIRAGEVDALVMAGQIYTLQGAETPYRVFFEAMNEGAATLGEAGTVLYANRRLAELLRIPLNDLIGGSLRRFFAAADWAAFEEMLAQRQNNPGTRESALLCLDGTRVPVQCSFSGLEAQGAGAVCVVITDLTEQERAQKALQQAHDELEQRVAERTRKLSESNAELERFNRAMVGRELRMIELKKEINELCAAAGQPPRYSLEFLKDHPTPGRPKPAIQES